MRHMSEFRAPVGARGGVTPRYFRVKVQLQERLARLGPGDGLPAERALALALGVSRTTLRKALAELSAEGLLRREHGSGTYVAPPKLVQVRQLTSLTEDLGVDGLAVESTVLGCEEAEADADTQRELEVAPGALIHRVTRLRSVDGEPLAIEVAALRGVLPGLGERLRVDPSLYRVLRTGYGREIDAVRDTVETALATPDEARLLSVAIGHPMLMIHRQGRDGAGVALEWTRCVYRGDRFRFVATARRNDAARRE